MKKQETTPKTREELFAEKAEKSYAVCYSETCPLRSHCLRWQLRTYTPKDRRIAACMTQKGSTDLIQRKFAIGYNRAGRLMEQLEKAGVVGEAHGSKPREVFIQDEVSLENFFNSLRW